MNLNRATGCYRTSMLIDTISSMLISMSRHLYRWEITTLRFFKGKAKTHLATLAACCIPLCRVIRV